MEKKLSMMMIFIIVFELCLGINLSIVSQAYGIENTLAFDVTPVVVHRDLHELVVQFKASKACTLYYKALGGYDPEIGSADLIAQGQSMVLDFGATTTVTFNSLTELTTYDLALMLKTDTEASLVYTIQNVYTWGNGNELAYGKITFVRTPGGEGHIYMPFKYDIGGLGPESHLTVTFNDGVQDYVLSSQAEEYFISSQGKVLDITIPAYVFSSGSLSTYATENYNNAGNVRVLFVSGEYFTPKIFYGTNGYVELPAGAIIGESQPSIINAEYISVLDNYDYILVTTDKSVETVPASVNVFYNSNFINYNNFSLTIVETSASAFKIQLNALGEATFAKRASGMLEIVDGNPAQLNDYNNGFKSQVYSNDTSLTDMILFYGTSYAQNVNTAPVQSSLVADELYRINVPNGILNNETINTLRLTMAPETYAEMVYFNGLYEVTIHAKDGSTAKYYLWLMSDPVAVLGLSYGAVPVTDFDPLAFYYGLPEMQTIPISTATYYETAPALMVDLADDMVSVDIVSEPVYQMPGSYGYYVTMSMSDFPTVEFNVQLSFTGELPPNGGDTPPPPDPGDDTPPPDDPPVDPGDDTPPTEEPPTDPGDNTPPPVVVPPTPTNDTDKNESPVAMTEEVPSQPEQTSTVEETLNELQDTLTEAKTQEQAIDAVKKTGDALAQVNASLGSNPEMGTVKAQVNELTLNVESKLMLIEDSTKQVEVLKDFLLSAKSLQAAIDVPMPEMNQSIGEMIQKVANRLSTTTLSVGQTEGPAVIDADVIQDAITKQVEGLKVLNELQREFFSNEVQKDLKAEIQLNVQTPQDAKALTLSFPQEVVGLLQAQKIESISVKNQNVVIKLPISEFGTDESTQVSIEQKPAPPVREPMAEVPKVVYEFRLAVAGDAKDVFSRPLTLTFDLKTFELESASQSELSVYKYDPELQQWKPVGGIVDPQSGVIFVKRDNLSQYTVLKSKKSFTDADNSWAKEEINAMLNKGIVSDVGKFEPKSLLTRGEFAQWIANAYGLKVSSKNLPFKDVPKDSPYYNAIAAVYQQGLLQGSKDKFNPDKPLTQNELAAALGKVLISFDNKQKSGKVTSKYLSQLKTTQMASWAEDDMALLMELGMAVNANSGSTTMTKEAVASAFMKFYRS